MSARDPMYDECSMGDLVVRAIQRGGDRVAFVLDDQAYTYRAYGDLLGRFVQALKARGLKRGDAIAVLSSNRPEAFLPTAAAYLMGLRITWMHPLGSEDDHVYLLEDSQVGTLFVDPATFAERARTLRARVPTLGTVLGLGPCDFGDDILAEAARMPAAPLVAEAGADDICTLIYTGGTTGRPKGVIHTQRVHVTMVMAELAEWDWPADVRFLAMTPITHAAGVMIMPVLLRSGTYVMSKGFDADRFLDIVARHRITATFLVPTMIYVLLDHPSLAGADLSSLQLIIYGAAPMSPARLKEGMQAFGPVFMQIYAQSEAPNALTVLRRIDHDPERFPQRLASCGRPIGNSQVRLLDDQGNEVPTGEVGEICVRGPLVMKGYWNKPEESAKALRHGWLYTGDLARADADGFLYIVDRSKDMIISGGFNVYPREVEDVLTHHPAVSAAAVIGVPDAKWGEAVKAVVVLRAGASVHAEELIALVRTHKGAVQAPKSVDFVDSLPVTGLGKPDKKALRARYWGGQDRAVH
ncbi:MAG TPA: AMP-binding protein [Quisquiliibacterium sp.]|nr:AMP-binding protein [Quisquiliibacterium sp.]HQN11252.1 AMP-binding protein [Quisquiliibacterium sp.]